MSEGTRTLLSVGDRVRALYPNERSGEGTIAEVSTDPERKPYKVDLDNGSVGYFHLNQVAKVGEPDPDEIDMQAICDSLKARGIEAYVEQTGGGCATIFAGPTETDSEGTPRYAAVAGPGSFRGPGWSQPMGWRSDFYIGADDEGQSDPHVVTETTTDAEIVDLISEQVSRTTTATKGSE